MVFEVRVSYCDLSVNELRCLEFECVTAVGVGMSNGVWSVN